MKTFATFDTSHHFTFLSVQVSPNSLRRFIELDDYDTNYFMFIGEVGYFRDVSSRFPRALQDSGVVFLFSGSAIMGSSENLGSHRLQGALQTGWEQHFFHNIFVSPKVGVGLAENWLNFGKGFPLERQTSFMGQVSLTAGASFYRGAAVYSIYAGGFYEQTLFGNPDYENMGPLAGVSLRTNWFFKSPPQKSETEGDL